MGLLRTTVAVPGVLAGLARAVATGAGAAAVPAVGTVGLLTGPARATTWLTRAATEGLAATAGLARDAVVPAARAVGTVVTGADPFPAGHVREGVLGTARTLFEPPSARHTRRVWAERGHAQVELAAPAAEDAPEVRSALRRHLERLDGVQWAAVNDVVGRVLVAFDDRRVSVGDVVGAVTAIEQARGGTGVFPDAPDHPADLEPLLAAAVKASVATAGVGAALLGRVLPVPRLTRHATLVLALLESQPRVREALTGRIGRVGADLALTGTGSLLHALAQSPVVPAIHAAQSLQQAAAVRARRQVWRAREPKLCRPEPEDDVGTPLAPPGERPRPLPRGPVETYRDRLAPTTLAGALGLVPLTRNPARSADLIKALTPKAATAGRESFAATLDLLLCRQGVLPMDGGAYRRLDRVDTVVVDPAALCTGPPVVVEADAEATDGEDAWDDAAVWTLATRLLGRQDAPRTGRHVLTVRGRRVGTATVAPELDPHAQALLDAATAAGLRIVLPEHPGTAEVAPAAQEVPPAGEPLLATVRRLQEDGAVVLLVSATDGPALHAADVGVAPVRAGRAPAWGADLVTGPGLADACRIVAAARDARALSRRAVETAISANVLGGLLASVGRPLTGQRRATTPGKSATTWTMLDGTVTAARAARRPVPPPTVHTPWHALDADDVLRRLAGTAPDAQRRRSVVGALAGRAAAVPVVRTPLRYGRTVVAELADPLTPVLATGAAATAVLGEVTDAVLVGSVTVGNALLSGLQRLRAETALESLLLEQDVRARRETGRDGDGAGTEEVPGGALRPGDVLVVEPGDVVAADARLLAAEDLEVDESNLTGESLAVAKSSDPTPGADVADRTGMLFDGTTVVAGRGRAVVVAVGQATQAGRAARAAGGAAPPAGVQARLGELTSSVLPWTLAGGGLVTGLSLLWRRPLRQAVSAGLAIAVAAVPEGLPLVATVAQQAAARRLSSRGAVVRSARVLEALGRVDTVCFDKTGTLTENRLRLVRAVGLDGAGEDDVLRLAAAAVPPGEEDAHETDRAVSEAAAERGAAPDGDPDAALPFAGGRGFSAAVRAGRLVVKGAPEVVLRRCGACEGVRERVADLAGEGLRVLLVADRAVDGVPEDLEDAARDLTVRGLVGLADTVRESSTTAVAQLRAAGIRVLVATGDHPETAAAIAAQAGIPDADRVVTGAQLAKASDEERRRLVAGAAVFARLSPEQKVTLVAALRGAGATLAMTGDGVNDAAAIRLADVGVGVAGAESPAARTAADLVLTDADLTRLVDAVAEGRAMWGRVREAVSVLVGGNAGEIAFTVLGTAVGGRSPLGTRQLLLVNLLTDMFPALAVAVATPRRAPAEDGEGPLAGHPLAAVLAAGPHRGFTEQVRRAVLVRGAATTVGATGAWVTGRLTGPRGRAGTMGLAALIATQLGQTAWAGRRSPLVLATTAGSLAVLVAVVQTPGVSRFFGCTPLDPVAWGAVLASAAAGTATAELGPRVVARLQR
ncbi:cation-translocating P-type ATPase [Trujillonella humicola]|uniref:cation-translocating P-type ATPase n=1 Tax=Trujillonella humicola TaxID=3383699 RepID=UPI0039065E54